MDEGDGREAALPSGARNVLLEAPATDTRSENVCVDHVAGQTPTPTRVLAVSYRDRAGAVVDQWRNSAGDLPDDLVVVEAREDGGETDHPEDVTVLSESPDDLTWLSVHASEYLSRWRERAGDVALCIDSLTAMLRHADLETVCRLLHIISGRVETADARARHHIDPRAHGDQELNAVERRCDAVLRYGSGTGGRTVQAW